MDDGQKTPRGHPDQNSNVEILRVLVFMTDIRMDRGTDGWTDGQMDGRTDGQTDKEINQMWASFPHYVPPSKARYYCN